MARHTLSHRRIIPLDIGAQSRGAADCLRTILSGLDCVDVGFPSSLPQEAPQSLTIAFDTPCHDQGKRLLV
jgi:hypothetical protein